MSTVGATNSNSLKTYAASLGAADRSRLREAVSQTVGEVFLGTLMREFRSSLDTDNPLTGGRTGAMFQSQLDQELLTRLAGSGRFQIGQAVADRWLGPVSETKE